MAKVVLVTGASAGVGRATAVHFAANGFDVALVARGAAGLEGAANEVRALGRRALILPTDVAEPTQVDAAASRAEDELGALDVWVNDAMTTTFSPVIDTTPAEFRRAVDVTFLGQVWGTMAALKRMRPRDRGEIVNVGSALAFMGIPLQGAYCASKFACRGFFESTRAELLHDGSHVRISMVHLPAVNTPQFGWSHSAMDRQPQPVPPIYEPEVAARAILQAALDGRRSKILGSWNKILIGFGQVAPGFGSHYAASAWESQLTDRPTSSDRPSNLFGPCDDTRDHHTHGTFDQRANGFLDPTYLRSLPATARTAFAAAVADARDRWHVLGRRVQAGH